ncbi:hypothetical protein HD598_000651 [Neomicrococcus aestuarii]|uniref:Uncharacterized protein n=1 Tax=Neomicrococcus aestuarii TaxID=556325 RepID=A0A7W8TSF5_9MICC|nr:hypothetical protein [Neomicrococcus aestuarii]
MFKFELFPSMSPHSKEVRDGRQPYFSESRELLIKRGFSTLAEQMWVNRCISREKEVAVRKTTSNG